MTSEGGAQSRSRREPMLLGLAIALLSPFALMLLPQPTDFAERAIRGTMIWTAITVVLLIIVVAFERQPLSSIGFKRLGWGALGFGVLGLVLMLLSEPLGGLLMRSVEAKQPTSVFREFGDLPIWVLAILPFRAAVTEEVVFRGYAMTRIEALTRSRILAFFVPAVVFSIAHAPVFGLAYALAVAPLATVLGLLFLWRRNLWANMIAHAGVDTVGLFLTWAMAHHLFSAPSAPH
jgi:membrane protease YdiL (CAAX protease family)